MTDRRSLQLFYFLTVCLITSTETHSDVTDKVASTATLGDEEVITSLQSLSEKFHCLTLEIPSEQSSLSFFADYEELLKFTDKSLKIGNADVLSKIQSETGEIITKLAHSDFEIRKLPQQSVTFTVVKKTNVAEVDGNTFLGLSALNSDWLEVRLTCVVSEFTAAVIVVYPKNRSPFRLLPETEFPISNFKVFDLFLVRGAKDLSTHGRNTCPETVFFEMVTIDWKSTNTSPSMRVACAEWSDQDGGWSSENCFLFAYVSNPGHVVCHCDTKNNRNVTEYIVYETVQDTDQSFKYSVVVSSANNSFEHQELLKYISLVNVLANQPENASAFVILVSEYLPKIISSPPGSIQNVTDILRDIGTIMTKVSPENNSCMIGQANNEISAFVFLPTTYRHSPLVGFDFSKNRPQWMTYYRSEEVDINRLFALEVEFSLLFSDSVARQNARYGFLLYPPDRYLVSTAVIGGHRVLASRVVDVVLVPYAVKQERQVQLIHLYLGYKLDFTKRGCAVWSPRLARWNESGCAENPAFYRSVCTCDLDTAHDGKLVRGQFVVYQYEDAQFAFNYNRNVELFFNLKDVAWWPFALHNMRGYPPGVTTANQAEQYLISIISSLKVTYKMDDVSFARFMEDTLYIWTVNECKNKVYDNCHDVVVACDTPKGPSDEDSLIAFAFKNKVLKNCMKTFTAREDFDVDAYKTHFTLYASLSLVTQNSRYAFIVYPMFLSPRPVPSVGLGIKMGEFRVVNIVLVPRNDTRDDVEQSVELYLSPWTDFTWLGCAYWSDAIDDWTSMGCSVFNVDERLEACNCSLATNSLQSPTGGLYITYHYGMFSFDMDVFFTIGSADLVADAAMILTQGSELINNASHLPNIDDEDIVKTFQTYLRVLMVQPAYVANRTKIISSILKDLDRIVQLFKLNQEQASMCLGIQGSWSVKTAGIEQELFSNAVLNAADNEDIAIGSAMTFFWLNLMGGTEYFIVLVNQTELVKLFKSAINETAVFSFRIDKGITPDSSLVVIVYPNNLSPFTMNMTSRPIFNARQLDVHVKYNPTNVDLHIDYNPESVNDKKDYIKVRCATWNEKQSHWVHKFCTISDYSSRSCRCQLPESQRVTHIVAYQYTDLPNFSFVAEVGGPLVVFLIGALLSFGGLTTIAVTAVAFPKWRDELSNKILMQLAASVFLNLMLTTFRETHNIYADTNHNNIGLIVFTVSVHYSRLTHFCWGLVMSVLQYRRFSSVVGASAIPHLLRKISLIAWGLPLVPLVALLSWNQQVHFCSPDKLTHYVLYLVPGAIITAVDIGLMVGIVYHITDKCGTGKDADLQRHNVNEKDLVKRRLKTVVLMFFLFGIPTVFEMSNDIGEHNMAVEYFSKIFDPVQGFVLFLFFIVLDGRTRGLWSKVFFG